MLQFITRTVSNTKPMLLLRQQLSKQQQCIMMHDDIRDWQYDESRGCCWGCKGCLVLQKWCFVCGKEKRASDALEQVRVAVGSSAAVTELPDARPELHGTPVTHPTLPGRGRLRGHSNIIRYLDSKSDNDVWQRHHWQEGYISVFMKTHRNVWSKLTFH